MKILLSIPDDLMKRLDEHCERYSFERSEFLRSLIRGVVYPKDISASDMARSSTVEQVPVKDEVAGPSPAVPAKIYDVLWEDSNWMPVKKERLPIGYCSTWHGQGEKRPLYSVTKHDVMNKILWKKLLCRECVISEDKICKQSGGHLE